MCDAMNHVHGRKLTSKLEDSEFGGSDWWFVDQGGSRLTYSS